MRRRKHAKKNAPVKTATKGGNSADLSGITPQEVLEPMLWLLDAVGVPRHEVLATVRMLPVVQLPMPVTVLRGQVGYWSRPLIRWASDPLFLGPDGRPCDLSFVAGDPSFSDLVALELPHQRPAVCRDILLAAGAIIRLPSGRLRWRDRAALATGAESGIVLADEYLRPLRALLLALQTNLLRRARGVSEGTFQRAASGFEISTDDMEQLQAFIGRHGTALLETVDDWLAQRKRSRRARREFVRPYFGLYLSTDSENVQFTLENAQSHARRPGRQSARRKASGP